MAVSVVFVVERRASDGRWARGEAFKPNPYLEDLARSEDFPKSQRGPLTRVSWGIGRNDWLDAVHRALHAGQAVPSDLSEETREHLTYWTDPDEPWGALSLRELEQFDWSQIDEELPGPRLRDELLPKLRALGGPDDVRLVYGWNV